jgi:hypothetical protein
MEAYSQRTEAAEAPPRPAEEEPYMEQEEERDLRMSILRRLEEVATDMNSENAATARHAKRAMEAFVEGVDQFYEELEEAVTAAEKQASTRA